MKQGESSMFALDTNGSSAFEQSDDQDHCCIEPLYLSAMSDRV